MTKPAFEELADRIAAATAHHGGSLPAVDAAMWAGYLAALLEWDLVTADDHHRLQDRLPAAAAAVTATLFLGYETSDAAAVAAVTTGRPAAGGLARVAE